MKNAGEFIGTTTGNRHNITCPACNAFICARCGVLEEQMAGLCGCEDCNAAQRRTEQTRAAHIEKDHVA